MAFSLLPVEVNTHIAGFLDADRDLCSFSRICPATHDAVACDSSPVWRTYFSKHFDLLPNISNNILRRTYQVRRKVLRQGSNFGNLGTKSARECLQVLNDLILESFSNGQVDRDKNGSVVSRNIATIEKFAKEFGIVQYVRIPASGSKMNQSAKTLLMVQIMLCHLQFDLIRPSSILGIVDSQKAMYATIQKLPTFTGSNKDEVNLCWVANAVNFFKYHFTHREEGALFHFFENLGVESRIRGWRKPLSDGTVGKNWKGIYCYVEQQELSMLRDGDDEIVVDIFNNTETPEGPFQTMQLDFPKAETKKFWPCLFEQHLQSTTGPYAKRTPSPEHHSRAKTRTRAQLRAPASSLHTRDQMMEPYLLESKQFHFYGTGVDGDPTERFYASGWLQQLPPQQGIHGMQRVTMMKFFLKEDGQENLYGMSGFDAISERDIDNRSLWAYEGVVLPGGEIMIGRWWSPLDPDIDVDGREENVYSGPFMFWCIDEEAPGNSRG